VKSTSLRQVPCFYISSSTALLLLLHLQTFCWFTTASAAATTAAHTNTTAATSSASFSSPVQPQLQQGPALDVCLQVCVPLPQQLIHSLEVPDRNHGVKFILEELLEGLLYEPLPVADLGWPAGVKWRAKASLLLLLPSRHALLLHRLQGST
jgi:hypothetical protein